MVKKNSLTELEEQIDAIQKAVEKIREFGIREPVIHLLIQRSAGTVGTPPKYVPIDHIKAVLAGMETLHDYVYGED